MPHRNAISVEPYPRKRAEKRRNPHRWTMYIRAKKGLSCVLSISLYPELLFLGLHMRRYLETCLYCFVVFFAHLLSIVFTYRWEKLHPVITLNFYCVVHSCCEGNKPTYGRILCFHLFCSPLQPFAIRGVSHTFGLLYGHITGLHVKTSSTCRTV